MIFLIHIFLLSVFIVLTSVSLFLLATSDQRYSQRTTVVFAVAVIVALLDILHDTGRLLIVHYSATGLAYLALMAVLLWNSRAK